MTPTHDTATALQQIANCLHALHRKHGYSVNLTFSPNSPADLRYSVRMPDPVEHPIGLYGWGADPLSAYVECAARRAAFAAAVESKALKAQITNIRNRHEAAAAAEIAALRSTSHVP